MIMSMQKLAKSVFFKIFLLMIAVSFVLWGIGDVANNIGSNEVASIGSTDLSRQEFDNRYQRMVESQSSILGRLVNEQEKEEIKRIVLDGMIKEGLFESKISDLGIQVSDNLIFSELSSQAAFQNEEGKFDINIFRNRLRENGLDEQNYFNMRKQFYRKQILLDTLIASPLILDNQAEAILKYRNELRKADLIYIDKKNIAKIAEPLETDLIQFYQDNKEKFRSPEYREVTYITFGVDNIKDTINISDEEARFLYEERKNDYLVPEVRNIIQYSFKSKEDAEKASKDIAKNAKKYNKDKVSLGDISKNSWLPELEDIVFKLEKNTYSEPVETLLGWRIFYVNNIIDGYIKDFADVKKELKEEISASRLSDELYKFADLIEDDFASGMKMEDVAKKHSFSTKKIYAIDSQGKGSNGKFVTDIPDKDIFLSLVFDGSEGEESIITILPDNLNYLVLRTDKVTPSRINSLDEVKVAATKLWKEDQLNKDLEKLSNELFSALSEGANLNSLKKKYKLDVKSDKEVSRPSINANILYNDNHELSSDVRNAIFDLKLNEYSKPIMVEDGKYLISKLNNIIDYKIEEEDLDNLKVSLSENYKMDIFQQYISYLSNEYEIDVKLFNDE